MKKNINKLVAIGIGISVMTANVVPVFAVNATINKSNISSAISSTNSANVLTLDKAIEAAQEHDEKIRMTEASITYYKDNKDYCDEIDDDNTTDENDINLDKAKQAKDFRKDAVAYETTNLYNTILYNQKQLEYKQELLKIEQVKLKNMKKQHELGSIDEVTLSKENANVQSAQNDVASCQNTLNDSKKELALSMGKQNIDFSLVDIVGFNKFQVEGNIDQYIEQRINTILKYNKELADLYADEVKDMKDDNYDEIQELSLPNPDNYKDADGNKDAEAYARAVSEATSKYQQGLQNYVKYITKKMTKANTQATIDLYTRTYKNTLNSQYSSALALENAVALLETNINIANKDLANAKLKYQLGLMTENDYDVYVAQYRMLDMNLRNTLNSYYKVTEMLEKPWVTLSNN